MPLTDAAVKNAKPEDKARKLSPLAIHFLTPVWNGVTDKYFQADEPDIRPVSGGYVFVLPGFLSFLVLIFYSFLVSMDFSCPSPKKRSPQ